MLRSLTPASQLGSGTITKDVDRLRGVSRLVDSIRKTTEYGRNEEIYGEYTGAEYWYCVVSGVVRQYVILGDGRRRIVDFLMPGDFFGFRPRHRDFFAADAILPKTIVSSYPRLQLELIVDSEPPLGRLLLEIASESISRSQGRLLIVGRVTAREKVRAFLSAMAKRSFDPSEETVVLPMSRYDIADYLAISVETVSRALSELTRRGSIKHASTRRIRVLKQPYLKERASKQSAA
jgi:CRP/FNR family transcriptional regulator, nitrogen fixation regulation protein